MENKLHIAYMADRKTAHTKFRASMNDAYQNHRAAMDLAKTALVGAKSIKTILSAADVSKKGIAEEIRRWKKVREEIQNQHKADIASALAAQDSALAESGIAIRV